MKQKTKTKLKKIQTRWESGIISQTYFEDENGKCLGLYKSFYESGEPFLEGKWKYGKQSGVWTGWYEDGKLRFKEKYVNGRQYGPSRCWDEDGCRSGCEEIWEIGKLW